MRQAARDLEQTRRAKARLRMIQHYEQVTRNVSQTCRFFGISRHQFYCWVRRYRKAGLAGLRDRSRRPPPDHTIALTVVGYPTEVDDREKFSKWAASRLVPTAAARHALVL